MSDTGEDTADGVFALLQIDDEWSVPVARGFAWWGHFLRQRIWSTPGFDQAGDVTHRVFAVTDAVRGAQMDPAAIDTVVSAANAEASGWAMIHDRREKAIRFWSAATVHAGNVGDMTRVFGFYAICQATDAHERAKSLAQIVKGEVDTSAHPERGARETFDEMLGFLPTIVVPKGEEPSPWHGSAEITEAHGLLTRGNWRSTADETGVTAELPFGERTLMARIRADRDNPRIGSGVDLALFLPDAMAPESAGRLAAALNRADVDSRSSGHLLGSWCVRSLDQRNFVAFASFLPTALHSPGLLLNSTLVMMLRAAWLKTLVDTGAKPEAVIDGLEKADAGLPAPG